MSAPASQNQPHDTSGLNIPDLPNDATDILTFTPVKKLVISVLGLAADIFGFWRTPKDHLINIDSLPFWAYWIYKTRQPITKGKVGCDQESYFKERAALAPLPDGFKATQHTSISAVGDLMCTAGLEQSQDKLYATVADHIFNADIRFANLESTLTTKQTTALSFNQGETPDINLSPDQYRPLIEHQGKRFTIVQLANNHILDCGTEGIDTTLAQLARDDIAQTGVNMSSEQADRGIIQDVKGLKIGWVSATYSVNFRDFPDSKDYLTNFVPFHLEEKPDTSLIRKQLEWCKAQDCDFIILGLHWGLEFEFFPHTDQIEWAHQFAEWGADLIIGHHPHVVQPVEIYTTQRDPIRQVPILYSLGNLTPLIKNPASTLAAIAKLNLATGVIDDHKRTYVESLDMVPVSVWANDQHLELHPVNKLQTYALSPTALDYADALAKYRDLVFPPQSNGRATS